MGLESGRLIDAVFLDIVSERSGDDLSTASAVAFLKRRVEIPRSHWRHPSVMTLPSLAVLKMTFPLPSNSLVLATRDATNLC